MKIQRWNKIRNIFCPAGNHSWMQTHAANPVAEHVRGGVYRIYFTCRNAQNQSHIGWTEIDFDDDFKILRTAEKPVLSPGELGLFDDSGTAMAWLMNVGNKKFLYYLGWNLKVTVPWLNTIGLAVLNDETGEFKKYSRAPLLDRSNEDPFSISYPCILSVKGKFRMWYGSNLSWGKSEKDMKHVFKYAESDDGINWKREGKIALQLEHDGEFALSKPMVILENGTYKMWYSFRAGPKGAGYRIGYAESADGLDWKRMDELVEMDVSAGNWDGEMICYPFILDHKGKRFMLYNGNGYGKTGFGIAIEDMR